MGFNSGLKGLSIYSEIVYSAPFNGLIFFGKQTKPPMLMAAHSKAWVCGLAGIAGSNSAGGIDVIF
jgi:hypothetical protein